MRNIFKFQLKHFTRKISFASRFGLGIINKRFFCNIERLNFDKLTLNQLELDNKFVLSDNKKKFIKEENIIELASDVNWEDVVLKSDIPVVVYCYAVWCGPCKKLFPMLEKKLEELQNFKIVRIDIDSNGDVADKSGISTVPTVYLLYKGNAIDNFVGLPDTKKLDNFFESISLITGMAQDEKVFQALLRGADEYMDKKNYDRAENMLNEAYSHQKWRKKYQHIIKMGLALCAFHKSDYSLSEKMIHELKTYHKEEILSDPILNKKISKLELKILYIKNPDLINKQTADIHSEIENNPSDLSLRYQLSVQHFENSEYEQAIDTLLEIIKIDRNWNKKAANQLLLLIFNFLGADHNLTVSGRNKLTKILY